MLKIDIDGHLLFHKACLVAHSDKQLQSINFDKKLSHVV